MESPKTDEQIRENQAEKITGFLDRTNAYDFFVELRLNPEKIKEIDFQVFEDFLVRINGIARGIPIKERRPDGENVHLEGFIESVFVPTQKDKIPLLKMAYDEIPNLAHQEDVAYILPLIINAVHLFEDGNGRSSRIIHLLLKPYASKEEFNEDLKKTIGIDGRYDSYDISPGFIGLEAKKIVLMNNGTRFGVENYGWNPIAPAEAPYFWITMEKPESQKGKEFMKFIQSDFQLCFACSYNYLKQKGLLEKAIIRHDVRGEMRAFLSPAKMDSIFQAEDWDNIVDAYYSLKKEEVEVMIKCFVEPDKYRSLDGLSTLRDVLLKKVEEHYQKHRQTV